MNELDIFICRMIHVSTDISVKILAGSKSAIAAGESHYRALKGESGC